MSTKKLRNKILIGIAIITLFIAFIYQYFANQQDVLSLLKQGQPTAAKFESLGGNYPSYKLWDEKGNFLGYAIIADASGYGGKLSVLTVIQETGKIKSVSILENHETPTYLKKVLNLRILGKITDQNIKDNLAGVDAISGATMTSEAIINSVQKGSEQIGNKQLGLSIPSSQKVNINWKDIVTVGLLLLAILACARSARKLRPWLLVLSVLFIGFMCNYSLTFGNFIGLLSGKIPVFLERPIWYIVVPGVLIITLVWGKNFYCNWLCPFGAVQEGLFHSLSLVEFNPSAAIKSKVGQFRWPILWLAAMLALLFNNGQIASYEPFPTFFNASGNTAQWIITILIVLLSITQIRFWCNNFCPVGLVLNFLAQFKRKLKRNKTVAEEQVAASVSEASAASSPCEQCSNPDCIVNGVTKERLSKQDKIFVVIAVIIDVLIILALLQNIMLGMQN